MNHIDGSKDVILLYMIDIEYYYQEFLKYLLKNSSSCLYPIILQVYENKIQLRNKYFNMIKTPIIFNSNNNFKNAIIRKLFFTTGCNYDLNNHNELYELLICMETKIVDFLKNYFYRFSYISSKSFLDTLINERQLYINKLQNYKSA